MKVEIRPERVAFWCALCAVSLGLAYLATQAYRIKLAPTRVQEARASADWPKDPVLAAKAEKAIRDPRGVVTLFDMDGEVNMPTTYSVLQLAGIVVVLALIARHSRQCGDGLHLYWKGLVIAFIILALDEGASLHSNLYIASASHEARAARGVFYFSWIIPVGIMTALFGLAYLRFLWKLPAATRYAIMFAGAWFVFSAIGGEMAQGKWIASGEGKGGTFALLTLIEEAGEMLSMTTFMFALLSYAARSELVTEVRCIEPAAKPVVARRPAVANNLDDLADEGNAMLR